MIICLQTSFKVIKKALISLKKANCPLSKTELKQEAPNIYNSLPIMRELGFIIRTSQGYELTGNGSDFATLLINNNKDEIKEYAQDKLLKKSPIISEAYTILTQNPDMDIEKLGKILNKKFSKKEWVDERTYKQVGKSCKDILDGFELYEYKDRKKGRGGGKHRKRHADKLLPYTSADVILKLLDESFKNDTWKATHDNFTESKNIKRTLYANTLFNLGIGKYINSTNNIVKLTEDGIKLKNANNFFDRQKIFQEIIIKHKPIKDILQEIINKKYEVVTQKEIGDILRIYNNAKWTASTEKSYAIKLLNWLKISNILDETGWGKYKISNEFISKHKDDMQLQPISHTNNKGYISILGNISLNLNRIIYSSDEQWSNDENLKTLILKELNNLSELLDKSWNIDKEWINESLFLINIGFEYKDKKIIHKTAKIISNNLYPKSIGR